MKSKRRIISIFLATFILFEIVAIGNGNMLSYAYTTQNKKESVLEDALVKNIDDSLITLLDGVGERVEGEEDFPEETPDIEDEEAELPEEGEPEIEDGESELPEENLENNIPEDSLDDSSNNEYDEIIPEEEQDATIEKDIITEEGEIEELLQDNIKVNNNLTAWEDLNKDGIINNKDVEISASQYNTMRGQAGYDEVSDINSDGIIDLYDITKVAKWSGANTKPPVGPRKIVIDPGHGGSDPGASGPNGTKEKDIILKVGLQVRDILKSKGYIVIMTRDGDYRLSETLKVDLEKRAQIANDNNADIFVSIHANSASTPTAHGTETYIYKNESIDSISGQLAKGIQSKLVNTLGLYNRGVKNADFSVLRNTLMPAALTELAFINNPKEEALLNTNEFQEKAASAIAEGIMSLTK